MVEGDVRAIGVGRKTATVFYVKRAENALYSTQLDTGETRKIGTLPPRGRITALNADETLAAGTYIKGEGRDYNEPRTGDPARAQQAHSLETPPNKER